MDINKLQLFSDIAQTKNLSDSAQRMGYTQSGVSHAINKLEKEMGVSLLKRTNHGVSLTKDAEFLLPKVRAILGNYDKLMESIDSITGLKKGEVNIGTYSSIARQWLPSIIKKFQELYPNIKISIHEGGVETIETWIYDGVIDLGFLSWRKDQNFKFISLARDNLYAVTSADITLPKDYNKTFPFSAFLEYPFIASSSGIDSDVSTAFEVANIKPNIKFSCNDENTIISMVENNLGISLLPEMFLKGRDANINIIPTSPCVVRTLGIGVMKQKNLSSSAAAFIQLAKKVVKELI